MRYSSPLLLFCCLVILSGPVLDSPVLAGPAPAGRDLEPPDARTSAPADGVADPRRDPGDVLSSVPSLRDVFPALEPADVQRLRLERARFQRLMPVWRLKGQRKLEQAFDAARQLVREDPGFAPAADLLVEIAQETKRLPEAQRFLEDLAAGSERPGDRAGLLYGLARVWLAKRAWEPGLESAREAIAAGCNTWRCYGAVAEAYRALHRVEEGERYFHGLMEPAGDDTARVGLAWLGLGDLLEDEPERWEQVEAALQQAVALLRPGAGWEQAQLLLGKRVQRDGRKAQFQSCMERCAVIYREIDDQRSEGRVLHYLARGYNLYGDAQMELYLRALDMSRELGDRRLERSLVGALGGVHYSRSEFKEALEGYMASLAISRELDDRRNVGIDLGNIGAAYWSLGEVQEAAGYFSQSLAVHREVGNLDAEATILNNLGGVYYEQGDLSNAAAYFEQALALSRRLGAIGGEAMALGNLGAVQLKEGDLRGGLELFERSLELYRKIGDRWQEARTLGNLGEAYQDLGEMARANNYFQQTLIIARELKDRRTEGIQLKNLGVVRQEQGRVHDAIDCYERALVVTREAGTPRYEGEVLGLLGRAYCALGEQRRGIGYVQQALETHRKLKDQSSEGVALGDLGSAYQALGETARALEYFEQALALHRRTGEKAYEMSCSLALARLLMGTGQRQAAQPYLERALELLDGLTSAIRDPDLEASYFARAASPYALHVRRLTSELPGSPAPALTPAIEDETFMLGERARARSFLRRVQFARLELAGEASPTAAARVREAAVRVNQARRFLNDAEPSPAEKNQLNVWLDERLEPFLERQQLSHGSLPEEAVMLRRQKEALERGTLSREERQALGLAMLEAREQAYADAERALRAASPAYRELVEPRLATLSDVQRVLDDRTVMLAYLLGEDESFAWVITRKEVRLTHLPGEAEITSRIEACRVLLRSPGSSLSELRGSARALYQILIGSAGDLLTEGKQLVVVPDGPIGLLPFEVLLKGAGDGATRSSPDGETWLGLDHAVTYTPSATLWCAAHRRTGASGPTSALLAVGDPLYDSDDCDRVIEAVVMRDAPAAGPVAERWSRLCYSGDELEAIRRSRRSLRFDRASDVFLERGDATEVALRRLDLSRFSILHFSAHGLSYEDSPLRSAIVLRRSTPDGEERPAGSEPSGEPGQDFDADGYLDLAEIMHLRLNADLVVLSACDTAVGRQRKGEGIESLARGFLMAGARRVVASLWPVSDRSTAQYMEHFYEGAKRLPIAEAALAARRALARDGGGKRLFQRSVPGGYPHPYYWAPFVVIDGGGPPGP